MRKCEQKDAAQIERRFKRHAHRRCFWTWPIGHCTHWNIDTTLTMYGECCRCGKTSVSIPRIVLRGIPGKTGPPDGWGERD